MNNTLKPNTNEAWQFLNNINPGFQNRVFSIDPVKSIIKAKVFAQDEEQAFKTWALAGTGKLNYYFLPNLPHDELGAVKPKKKDIAWVTHLYVDIDVPSEATLNALKDHIPKPSCIIFSGGGYQAFWALQAPTQDFTQAERINEALASNLDGDSCHSVDHIMRLPGTINVPNATKLKKGRVPTLAYVVSS